MNDKIDFSSPYEKRMVIGASILLMVFSGPYFCWWITHSVVLKWLTTLMIGYIFYRNTGRLKATENRAKRLYVFALMYLVLSSIFRQKVTFFGAIDLMQNLFLVNLLCINVQFSRKVYKYYHSLFTGLMFLSILAYLVDFFGFLPSLGTINNPIQDRTYTIYPFLVKENLVDIYSVSHVRFCGAFDEPGAIGTISAVLLCIEQFKFNNWKNIVLLITGLLSMSLAFYLIFILYSISYVFFIKKKLIMSFMIIMSLGIFYYYTQDNEMFEKLIWNRMKWNEETQSLAGENRMVGDADMYFDKHVKGTYAYWFGLDDVESFWKSAKGSSSYKVVIAENGILFLFMYLLCFIMLAFKYKSSKFELLMFLALLIANTMQRPNLYSALWIFLYAYYARLNYNEISSQKLAID